MNIRKRPMGRCLVLGTVLLTVGACAVPQRQAQRDINREVESRVQALESQVEVLMGVAHTPHSSERIARPKNGAKVQP